MKEDNIYMYFFIIFLFFRPFFFMFFPVFDFYFYVLLFFMLLLLLPLLLLLFCFLLPLIIICFCLLFSFSSSLLLPFLSFTLQSVPLSSISQFRCINPFVPCVFFPSLFLILFFLSLPPFSLSCDCSPVSTANVSAVGRDFWRTKLWEAQCWTLLALTQIAVVFYLSLPLYYF